ncbi:hypothetical protein [Limnovirga soli]|uniref:Uncharacterized protein n=1 Tax=Limnovirga soli TaxID=2656915 RepID=A0A8J8FEC1_9BACT|nr:hypothetical protein [Limnovirga soli]NNV56155.1 hypothetical protein [Limnovirga soli]
MKKTFFPFLFLIICVSANSQTLTYYDAKALKEISDQNGGRFKLSAETRQILVKYYGELTDLQITAAVGNTPFLKDYFRGPGAQAIPPSFDLTSLIKKASDLNVTNFADGLAKFLVERSKEELNIAFFRKLQEFLKKYPETKILFPSTVSIINNIAAYNYAAMLPALRASFQKDLIIISSSLLNLREAINYEGYSSDATIKARADSICDFLNNKLAGRSISGAIITTNEIIKGNNAAEVIAKLATDRICSQDDVFSNSIQFVDLISQSLRSNDEGRVWITKQQVADLVTNETTLKLYLGLLYASDQKNPHHISFTFTSGNSIDLKTILTDLSNTWNTNGAQFKETFNNLAISASEVSDNAKNIIAVKKDSEPSSILTYANYASSISNFLKLALQLLPRNNKIDPSLSNITADIQKFVSIIDAATDACYDIKSQNYGALILHTSLILAEIPNIPTDVKDGYVKYGTFMASIVEAKNSDEVKAAIEAAVLPVGSSSIKRETNMNISLNAFIGPFAGSEYLPTLKENQWAFSYGITAPVGLAFSWGNGGKFNKNHPTGVRSNGKEVGGKSSTIFISLIDVGSLVSFRAGDDSSKVLSEVKLSNIISPGLYYYLGFGKCPISLGFGAQLGPQLREVTATDININKNLYVRFGMNLVVDIPFFNFYTKSK